MLERNLHIFESDLFADLVAQHASIWGVLGLQFGYGFSPKNFIASGKRLGWKWILTMFVVQVFSKRVSLIAVSAAATSWFLPIQPHQAFMKLDRVIQKYMILLMMVSLVMAVSFAVSFPLQCLLCSKVTDAFSSEHDV